MKNLLRISFLCLLSLAITQALAKSYTGYRFGALVSPIHANQTIQTRASAYQAFSNQLAKQLKQPVQFVPFHSTTELWYALDNNKIDFAYVKTLPYLKAKLKNIEVSRLAVVTTRSPVTQKPVTSYSSVIVTLANSKIKTLGDLKGKHFGFVSKHSTSGFLYPAMYLAQHGIQYDKNLQPQFFSSHLATLDALNHHLVDAIANWEGAFIINSNKNTSKYRILATISNIPNPLFVANKNITQSQQKELVNALLKVPASKYKGLTFIGVSTIPHGLYQSSFKLLQGFRS